MKPADICNAYKEYKDVFFVILFPILFSPLLAAEYKPTESKCAFVVLVMVAYWVTEALPLPITAFLPTFMFPLLGVLSTKETCVNYLKDANFLFVGGIMFAIATEECNLHKRIALKVLLKMGSQPRWLTAGFMLTSCFLSMWMSNVATVAMMAPIAICVLEELVNHSKNTIEGGTPGATKTNNGKTYDQTIPLCKIDLVEDDAINKCESVVNMNQILHEDRKQLDADAVSCHMYKIPHEDRTTDQQHHLQLQLKPVHQKPTTGSGAESTAPKNPPKSDEKGPLSLEGASEKMKGLCKAVLLGISFAASIGGTGTLTGTGPNIVLTGQLSNLYPTQSDVTFASWMAFAIPPMVVALIVCWFVLLVYFVGIRSVLSCGTSRSSDEEAITKILQIRYEELGKLCFAEISLIIWFFILVFLWVFRDPVFIPGWESWLGLQRGFNSDAVPGMLVSCILFAWPNQNPFQKATKKRGPIMTWTAIQRKFPWSVVMLLGGGYAVAAGVKESKLDTWLGTSMMTAFGHLPTGLIAFVMVCVAVFLTQFASNSAVATVFIPVLGSMANSAGVNPLYYVLPATIAASYSFTMPVSTPPNAVVFEYKAMKMMDMIISGTILSIACIFILMLNVYTVGFWLFSLDQQPAWAVEAANLAKNKAGMFFGNATAVN